MGSIKRNQDKNICSSDMFKEIVSTSKSFNEIRERLKIGGYDNTSLSAVKKRIDIEDINIDHLKGKSWNKGFIDFSRMQAYNYCSSNYANKALIFKRGNKCQSCGLSKWLAKDIPLEVHHIDGDKMNNAESNLLLLCPNCHYLTDNFRGRNVSGNKKYISEQEFAEVLQTSKNVRQALIKLNLSPKGLNYSRAYDIAGKYHIEHILEH